MFGASQHRPDFHHPAPLHPEFNPPEALSAGQRLFANQPLEDGFGHPAASPHPYREPFNWQGLGWGLLALALAAGFVYWIIEYDQARTNRNVVDGEPTYLYDEGDVGRDLRANRTHPTINWGGKR